VFHPEAFAGGLKIPQKFQKNQLTFYGTCVTINITCEKGLFCCAHFSLFSAGRRAALS
jgi:hypothetical protein